MIMFIIQPQALFRLYKEKQGQNIYQNTTNLSDFKVIYKGIINIKIKAGKKIGSYAVKYKGMPAEYNLEKNKMSDKKLILFFNRPSDFHWAFNKCEFNKCEYTDDKSDYLISDAILFHAPYVHRKLKDLPPKPNGQIWVYMSQEPPSETFTSYKDWINAFNWTWSNRRDSDIYDPYGEVQVNSIPLKLNFSDIFKMKNKTALWFVSHCKTRARREDYVKLLQKYIDVDILGRCSYNSKRDKRDKYTLAKFYKFHISFENSLCKDYITEKSLHILPSSIVPIVRGEPTSELFLPPGSYIDTKNFKSSSQLGKYLKELAINETEYIQYFKWKKYYNVFQNGRRGTCSFCKLLHTAQHHRVLYNDIDAWINNPGGKPLCINNPQDLIDDYKST
ncbi:hypothetical protein KUTeg_007706 [Tegillarca granosa]|uniref:Fucosyltransferase n=1 Tax=Tegillarca granosa TaxID=220873 RepID=A0ABQ9FFZ3_TEGGR|nr:hypothetical protein KUTeg_007706 [Tegillarca granosa]